MKTYSSEPGRDEKSRLIPCPLCGGDKFRSRWECGSFRFSRCLGCGLIMQNPQILPLHAHSRYDEEYCEYEKGNEESFLHLMKLGLQDAGFDRWEEEQRVKGPLLDIGCATGSLIRWLGERGWEAEGLEICSASAERARSGGQKVYELPLEKAALSAEAYSVIHSSHVIEHVNDPRSFVREIHRLLMPGGYFLCVTPNTASFQGVVKKEKWRSAIADHLILFSARRLKKLLEQEGFRIIARKTWGGAPAGSVPAPVKKIMDRAAKKGGWGDVVMLLAEKIAPLDNTTSNH
ncbi:MAG: class I SAM-dependent methyltransferase [Spirochaetales bacterium]|nr:class I SAM-dependent methyltransferase [Spirochaetales bacterium]